MVVAGALGGNRRSRKGCRPVPCGCLLESYCCWSRIIPFCGVKIGCEGSLISGCGFQLC